MCSAGLASGQRPFKKERGGREGGRGRRRGSSGGGRVPVGSGLFLGPEAAPPTRTSSHGPPAASLQRKQGPRPGRQEPVRCASPESDSRKPRDGAPLPRSETLQEVPGVSADSRRSPVPGRSAGNAPGLPAALGNTSPPPGTQAPRERGGLYAGGRRGCPPRSQPPPSLLWREGACVHGLASPKSSSHLGVTRGKAGRGWGRGPGAEGASALTRAETLRS